MSPEAEQKLIEDVKLIKEALVGNLDGKRGALQNLSMVMEDVYSPGNPEFGIKSRLRKVEDREQQRKGMIAMISFIASSLAMVIGWAIGIFGGKK